MESNMLEFVGSIAVPAMPRTVITRHYLEAQVHIARWSPDFYEFFCDKVEEPTDPCVLRVHTLICQAYGTRIANEASKCPDITIGQLIFVTKCQEFGQPGILRTDGSATLAFTTNKDDARRNLAFGWSPKLDDWYMKDFPMERETGPWGSGVQVITL